MNENRSNFGSGSSTGEDSEIQSSSPASFSTGTEATKSTSTPLMGGSTAEVLTSHSHSEKCDSCGTPLMGGKPAQFGDPGTALDGLLGSLGVNSEMLGKVKETLSKVDVDEYLSTAREYMKASSGKARDFAKDNPGKLLAGLAVITVGAGLLFGTLNKDKESSSSNE